MKKLLRKITLNMVVFLLGLGLLCAGITMIYPPAALIAAGLVLMLITIAGGEK